MPVQRFEPMTKDFATFDCDAHVTEPPVIWERAHEYLSEDELQALKTTIWFDSDSSSSSLTARPAWASGLSVWAA